MKPLGSQYCAWTEVKLTPKTDSSVFFFFVRTPYVYTLENANSKHFVVLLVTTTDSPYALSFARQNKEQTHGGNKEGYGVMAHPRAGSNNNNPQLRYFCDCKSELQNRAQAASFICVPVHAHHTKKHSAGKASFLLTFAMFILEIRMHILKECTFITFLQSQWKKLLELSSWIG